MGKCTIKDAKNLTTVTSKIISTAPEEYLIISKIPGIFLNITAHIKEAKAVRRPRSDFPH
jgi:hypothetical protein